MIYTEKILKLLVLENYLNCQIFGRFLQSGSKVNFLDSEVSFWHKFKRGDLNLVTTSPENFDHFVARLVFVCVLTSKLHFSANFASQNFVLT